MTTTLWHFPFSHFNEKVRWALDHKGWPHVRRALVPGFHIPRVLSLTGMRQKSTPVLEIDGEVLVDSTNIIAELERRKPERPLYPSDPQLRRQSLEIEDELDEKLGPDMRRLFYDAFLADSGQCTRMSTVGGGGQTAFRMAMPLLRPIIRADIGISNVSVKMAHSTLSKYLRYLDMRVGPSGYLVGDSFSIADLTAASLLSLIVRSPKLQYALPDGLPTTLRELAAKHEMSRGYRWVLQVYQRHRPASAEITAS